MTVFNADTNIEDYPNNHWNGVITIKNYATVECTFVFMNKKHEQLELMASFSAGITNELDNDDDDHTYSWADEKLVISAASTYNTLNKMIIRPECAPKYLRELLPDITDMFCVGTQHNL